MTIAKKKEGVGLKAVGQTMNPKLKQGAPATTPVSAGTKTARQTHKTSAKKSAK